MPLANDILSALAVLNRRGESVQAVMGTNKAENRFSIALAALEKLAIENELPIAIVGGLAAIRYGYPAVTDDIDVAVAQSQLGLLLSLAPHYGFRVVWTAKSGWHTLEFGDVEINIVPEGGRARDTSPTSIPGPAELGVARGLGYASLPSWMELKISSGRQKDRAHIVEVLKKSDSANIASIREHLSTVHEGYLQMFEQLVADAQLESEQENERR